jgi:hypothetical protein
MPSYSEWLAAQSATAEAAAPLATLHQQTRRLVIVRMEDLLASDDWGVYARHLEGLIQEAAATLAALQAQILGDAAGDDLARLKAQAKYAQGRLDGLQEARGLPDRLRAGNETLTPPESA